MSLLPAAILLLTALAPPPAPLTLTPAEEQAVEAGEIVVREGATEGDPITGLAYVAAPPQAVIDQVVNLTARQQEVGAIQSLEMYLQEPGRIGARWEVGMMGLSTHFHVIYEFDRELGWCTFVPDESRENGIDTDPGSYQAIPHGDGSLLIYRAGGQGNSAAPDWLRSALQSRSLKEQMGGIRARAEARR